MFHPKPRDYSDINLYKLTSSEEIKDRVFTSDDFKAMYQGKLDDEYCDLFELLECKHKRLISVKEFEILKNELKNIKNTKLKNHIDAFELNNNDLVKEPLHSTLIYNENSECAKSYNQPKIIVFNNPLLTNTVKENKEVKKEIKIPEANHEDFLKIVGHLRLNDL